MIDTEGLDWLRHCWVEVDVAAVEHRFGITYRAPRVPAGCPNPEQFRVDTAREWIAEQRHRFANRPSMEILAKRLIIAQLENDPEMRDLYTELVRADIGSSDRAFHLAVEAAKAAVAAYTPAQRPAVRERLLAELDDQVPA